MPSDTGQSNFENSAWVATAAPPPPHEIRFFPFVSHRPSSSQRRKEGNSFLNPLTPFVTRRAVHVLFRSRLCSQSLMVIVHDPAAKKQVRPYIRPIDPFSAHTYLGTYTSAGILHSLLHRKRSDLFVLNSLEFSVYADQGHCLPSSSSLYSHDYFHPLFAAKSRPMLLGCTHNTRCCAHKNNPPNPTLPAPRTVATGQRPAKGKR